MALSEHRQTSLARIVADHVPLEILADIVADHAVVTNLDEIVRRALSQNEQKDHAVALEVVQRYDAAGAIDSLLSKIRLRMRGNDFLAVAFVEFAYDDASAPNLEAAIAKRARMLRGPELREFLEIHEPRICVIAGVADRGNGDIRFPRGTGFLVAEDLVITARHVLAYHVNPDGTRKDPFPGPLYAFFDHLDGPPIRDPRDPNIGARRVAFHPTDWLKAFSDQAPGDGETPPPLTPEEIQRLTRNLDVVLIRLAEPIGAYSRWRSGGARRGWVSLPDEAIPAGLAVDDRILIPQHPNGDAQQIDFGRYKLTDESLTRIRYDTETDMGTSGAPCFNQHFQLVGMHNAAFKPRGAPKQLNQAIRFDHVMRTIRAGIPVAPIAAPAPLWSVAESTATPEVIIGRTEFLKWLENATKDKLGSRAERVYAAPAARTRCGKSFSVRILRAALRGKPDPLVLMGTSRQALPSTALDLIAIIADQLKIPADELLKIPKRPDSSLPQETPDGDKLYLWLSRDLPQWFNEVLRKSRALEVDLRAEAKAEVDRFIRAGLPPPVDDAAIAALETTRMVMRSRWERIWIVLDDVTEDTLQQEVGDLLAALIGTRSDESTFHEELRRIRWLFLGSQPGFLADACVETLDQMNVTDDDIASCIQAFAASINSNPSAVFLRNAVAFVEIRRSTDEASPVYKDPTTRLPFLQKIVAELQNYFVARLGRPAQ